MKNFIGIDPGYTGGICIIENGVVSVFRMPVSTTAKGKNCYDVESLVNLLKSYSHLNPSVAIENVHTMPGQGVSSSGALLEGKGIIIGACAAIFNKMPTLVSPQSWKKKFPDLTNSPELVQMKNDLDKLKKSNANKKSISNLNAKYKHAVKTRTRELASKLYPNIADNFKLVRDDGKADALFIALYLDQQLNQQVS